LGREGNYIKNNGFNQVRFSNLTIKDKEVFKKREFSSRLVRNRYGIRINRKTKSTIPQSLFNYEFLVRNNIFIGSLDVNDNIENNDLIAANDLTLKGKNIINAKGKTIFTTIYKYSLVSLGFIPIYFLFKYSHFTKKKA